MNEEQLRIIAENSPREAAKILNVHIRQVRYYKEKMEKGMKKQKKQPEHYKKWTQEEDNYLIKFAENSTYLELQEVIKATRSQIDYRCLKLGISPKKLKRHKTTLTKEEKEICLTNSLNEAAEKLGVSIQSIKRRRKELREPGLFDARTPVPLPPSTPTKSLINFSEQPIEITPISAWTPEDDQLLIKRVTGNSADEVAKLFGKTREEIRERLQFLLEEEKAKIGINEILSQFPGMTAGQIYQMKLIYSYSPRSAVRYCESIRDYTKNKAAYTPARIRSDR